MEEEVPKQGRGETDCPSSRHSVMPQGTFSCPFGAIHLVAHQSADWRGNPYLSSHSRPAKCRDESMSLPGAFLLLVQKEPKTHQCSPGLLFGGPIPTAPKGPLGPCLRIRTGPGGSMVDPPDRLRLCVLRSIRGATRGARPARLVRSLDTPDRFWSYPRLDRRCWLRQRWRAAHWAAPTGFCVGWACCGVGGRHVWRPYAAVQHLFVGRGIPDAVPRPAAASCPRAPSLAPLG